VVVVRCWLLGVGCRVFTVGCRVLVLVVRCFGGSRLLMVVGRRLSSVDLWLSCVVFGYRVFPR
jgi:hypothetical protein